MVFIYLYSVLFFEFRINSNIYIDMWLITIIVKTCLKLTDINIQLSLAQSTFHFNFEKSVRNAVKEIFPNYKIKVGLDVSKKIASY